MNMRDVQVVLIRVRPCRRTAFSGTIDECAAQRDHVVGNLTEDHLMTALGKVPCNGCRACCLHDMISPMPERGDLNWTYEHEVAATSAGPMAVLQCGESGECIYLGRDGCTIHDRAPAICRAFDCRDLFLSKTRAGSLAQVKSGVVSNEVFTAGYERLKTLDLPQ
jgi:hypothetical protein